MGMDNMPFFMDKIKEQWLYMQISMIAAMAHNRVIGKNNQMPWELSEDLKHFKAQTLGKPVVMGRKTYESIGRPLPQRHNIIISRNSEYKAEGVDIVPSFEQAVELVKRNEPQCKEIVIIGGGMLYQQLLSQVNKLYITEIDIDVDGDTWFPEWNDGSWIINAGPKLQSAKGLGYQFIEATRK